MRRVLLVGLAALIALTAGCIGAQDSNDDLEAQQADVEPPVPLDTVVDQTHSHDDEALHDESWNLEQIGHHTGFEDPSEAENLDAKFGFHGFAVDPPYAYLCRGGEDPGIVVVDTSNPEQPEFVAHVSLPLCNDAEIGPEGDWLFAGSQRDTVDDVAQPSEVGPASAPRATYVIDVSDPTSPAIESIHPLPYNGPHTLTTIQDDEEGLLVLHQTYDLYSTLDPTGQAPIPAPDGAAPLTHRSEITRLTQAPDGTHQLEKIGAYSATGETVANPDDQVIIHDAVPAVNPHDGTRYLLVAYWDLGVHILNFEDPRNPELVGTFEDFSPSEFANVHQVRAFPDLIDDKWVLVAEPEIGTADESGQLTFIDASDPSQPTKLGHWTLPGNVSITEPYRFSPHNFALDRDGHVHLGHFHAGVWTIGVDGPGTLADPATVGFHQPTAPDVDGLGGPMTWGVEEHGDRLYAMDAANGLHVLDYTGP
jgi:hypothetical protein